MRAPAEANVRAVIGAIVLLLVIRLLTGGLWGGGMASAVVKIGIGAASP